MGRCPTYICVCEGRSPTPATDQPVGQNFGFSEAQITATFTPSCPQARGVGHRHRTLGWDCGGRGGIGRGKGLQGGINSVSGLQDGQTSGAEAYGKIVWIRRLMVGAKSVEGKSARPGTDEPAIRRRRGHESPIPRGERDISRKAIAQGMSDVLRCPVCSCAASLHNFAHETAGAARIRHSLLPRLRGTTRGKPRVTPAARTRTYGWCLKMKRISLSVIASAAKQSILATGTAVKWIASLRSQRRG
jgi:hypothetical protein